tara:strand:+ start:289 stop:528 length:240 start_codon:yes stop_codon:yes gene_type:complete
MKGEKQSRVEVLEKKVDSLIRVAQQLLNENTHLKELSIGTLETIKLMPSYGKAIKKLQEKAAEEASEAKEAEASGEDSK